MKTNPRQVRRLVAALSLALGAGLAVPVLAMPGHGPGMAMGQGGMGGMGGMEGMGGMGGMGGPMLGGMPTRMLDRVNATPEQRAQIEQILRSGAEERRSQHEAARALREQAMALFAQPTVDANAVEVLRQKQLAMQDAASKRMMATMVEVSRVLTPEQRKQMAEHMAQRREMMQRHQRERQSLEPPKR